MVMSARVLIADDDRAIRDALTRALGLEGYDVVQAADGNMALTLIESAQPDVAILDVMMPNIDGLTVCRVLRAERNRLPVLMLTARTETPDRVAGLDAGADDYLAKPFDLDELLARLRALLRRTKSDDGTDGDAVQLLDVRLDPTSRRVWRGEREIELSKTEFDLLELLLRNQGIVLDHSTIYDRIWGYDFGPDSKNLAVYISYLRRKLELLRRVEGHPHRARRGILGTSIMSLRLKIVLALVLLATCATAAVGVSSYVSTRHELNEVVDRSLTDAAANPTSLLRFFGRGGAGPGFGPGPGGFDPDADGDGVTNVPPRVFDAVLAQIIRPDGTILRSPASGDLPVDDADKTVASGTFTGIDRPRDVTIDGEAFRMLTVPVQGGGAVQIARSARETERALAVIRTRTLFSVALVIFGAVIAGWLIGRQVTRRLVRLTQAADDVAVTGRLDVEVPVSGSDETGRLAVAFNGMLGALARSRDQQQQLVQDAGHELRTPLTSLRTNVAVLRRMDNLAPDARHQLVDDLDSETKELTALVNELVELATDRRDDEPEQDADLGALCEQAATRVRRRTGRTITVVADGSLVSCRPAAIDRAVVNLIDNAAKFSAAEHNAGGVIDVEVTNGRVAVSDRGPGIPADDLPHIFDRFYRSVSSRSLPGSGLGLAIVRDIVESHGGTVFAMQRDGGGTTVGFTLPTISDEADVPLAATTAPSIPAPSIPAPAISAPSFPAQASPVPAPPANV